LNCDDFVEAFEESVEDSYELAAGHKISEALAL
jgi:hypothetical protein